MSQVRPFVKSDIPQVVGLFRKVFFDHFPTASVSELSAYFEDVFFHHPWIEEDITSLVYETKEREITGFIAITPRRMLWRGQPIRVAVSMHFMVEPGSRSTLAGVQLLKSLFSGPQDLSLTDGAGAVGRKIWEGLGGATALPYSLNWTHWLQPSRYLLSLAARKHRLLALPARALDSLCPLPDAVAARLMPHRFGKPSASLLETELNQQTLPAAMKELLANEALRPDHDTASLAWTLAKAERMAHPGKLCKVALRDAEGELIGWFIYKLGADRVGEVLQVVGRKKSYGEVLNHLFAHGLRNGAIAFTGQLDPRFAQEFVDKNCFLGCGSPWTLVHSRNPELLQAFHQGSLFLSKLEGEWCLRFPG